VCFVCAVLPYGVIINRPKGMECIPIMTAFFGLQISAHSGFYENALYKFTFTYLLTYLLQRHIPSDNKTHF